MTAIAALYTLLIILKYLLKFKAILKEADMKINSFDFSTDFIGHIVDLCGSLLIAAALAA
ncbi:hypothetical protein ACFY6K_04975 [Lysinibacillus capsici]|uniref:hypothetical protein n=1 Tax=Lysinibacillus capsici TaxID=2115968 RepID=UPI0036B29269